MYLLLPACGPGKEGIEKEFARPEGHVEAQKKGQSNEDKGRLAHPLTALR
jgi:hypothetical protein